MNFVCTVDVALLATCVLRTISDQKAGHSNQSHPNTNDDSSRLLFLLLIRNIISMRIT
jgi:hypothetical protein